MVARIFLTNLGKYNEGELIGEWVELPTKNGFDEVFERIGINERYEEWFVTDYESEIDGFHVEEFDNIEELDKMCREIEELTEDEREVLGAILESGCYRTIQQAIEKINYVTYYSGDVDEILDEMIDEEIACLTIGGKVPELFTRYFDYEAYKRDIMFDFTETSNGIIYNY